MTKKIYLETLKSVLGRSIFHYFHSEIHLVRRNVVSTRQSVLALKKIIFMVDLWVKTARYLIFEVMDRNCHSTDTYDGVQGLKLLQLRVKPNSEIRLKTK